MADPHIRTKLDLIDNITVTLYRGAFLVAGLFLLLSVFFTDLTLVIAPVLCSCALISGSSVHIYNKYFRWLLQGSALFAIIWLQTDLWTPLALGAALSTYSGLAIKEYFCFRYKILLLTPPLLIIFWFCSSFLTYNHIVTLVSLAISGLLLIIMGIIKCNMPMDFDIGDRSKYQI